jgi:hypothetical protein
VLVVLLLLLVVQVHHVATWVVAELDRAGRLLCVLCKDHQPMNRQHSNPLNHVLES